MNFEKALSALKIGKKVVRSGWSGAEKYVILIEKSDTINDVEVLPHFLIRVVDEGYAMFQPTVCDILAEDWELVND